MSKNTLPIPHGTNLKILVEPVLGQPGIEALSPRIASVFGRWSALEKQLDQILTLITDADSHIRTMFNELKGWDRRTDFIGNEAEKRLDVTTADMVKIVLRLTKTPASKRDSLAHRVWSMAEGFETEIALMPPDYQHIFAESIVAVKKAGNCNIAIDNSSIYEGISLISARYLDELILELHNAQNRMDCLLRGYLYPPFADATGNDFEDYRKTLTTDSEVLDRLTNINASRQRAQKAARKSTK